jgi:hypothetical protein
MKKAKFMLMAVAVLGIVGGALAFKSNRGLTLDRFTCDGATPAKCTIAVTLQDVDVVTHGQGTITKDGDIQNNNCQADGTCNHLYFVAQ